MQAAGAHLRFYLILGVPRSNGALAGAQQMAAFVTAFAQRCGQNGTFRAQNPQLPYLPVEGYEIGNEPHIGASKLANQASLQYANPSLCALVYGPITRGTDTIRFPTPTNPGVSDVKAGATADHVTNTVVKQFTIRKHKEHK